MASGHSRIGIIGTGAIGGFYGLMLARAGQDVHFLLRSEYAAVTARGLRVESQVHGALQLDSVQAYRQAADMPPCDWLFVAAKTTSNAALAPAIVQAAAPGAKVVLLQNGLGVEDALRPLLRDDMHLLGGLCAICAHRAEPGIVVHQALGAVNLGYHTGPADAEQRQRIVDEGVALFRAAGIDSTGMPSLAQARWMKLVWNAAFNGLSVLLDADTRTLLRNDDSRELVRLVMQEVEGAAQACGYTLPPAITEKMLQGTAAMPDYLPSMYHDHRAHRPMELEAIYAVPLAQAAQAGYAMPRTEVLYRALCFLDAAAQPPG